MNCQKLYKRTTTGAIQVWWLELDEGRYRTHSGQKDGAIVVSEWTHAKPKNLGRSNATSPAEQATSEVEAKYERKRKDGYNDTVKEAAVSTRFQPMLAKEFDEHRKKVDFAKGVWGQPKLDGIRCIATAEGLWSRKGDPIVSCPHIMADLRDIFEAYPNLSFDGELYNHVLKDNFNEITSLVKTPKPTPEHLVETAGIVQFHIYDSPTPGGVRYQERLSRIWDLTSDIGPPLIAVPTEKARDWAHLDEMYARWLEEGYEGMIVRIDHEYEQKRTHNLLKRKEFVDSEFIVLEILEGQGNASGGAKIAWLQLDIDKTKKFKADVVGTKAERAVVLAQKDKLIGKKATVKYFKQRTPAGIPRFGKIKLFHMTERW